MSVANPLDKILIKRILQIWKATPILKFKFMYNILHLFQKTESLSPCISLEYWWRLGPLRIKRLELSIQSANVSAMLYGRFRDTYPNTEGQEALNPISVVHKGWAGIATTATWSPYLSSCVPKAVPLLESTTVMQSGVVQTIFDFVGSVESWSSALKNSF